MAQSMMEYQTK